MNGFVSHNGIMFDCRIQGGRLLYQSSWRTRQFYPRTTRLINVSRQSNNSKKKGVSLESGGFTVRIFRQDV
jgi:hypothetical protein